MEKSIEGRVYLLRSANANANANASTSTSTTTTTTTIISSIRYDRSAS